MKPVIFTILARWDADAKVWCGECDDVPIAVDSPTLDGLLEKAAEQARDLLPDNHPGVDPASVHLQLIALQEAAISRAA